MLTLEQSYLLGLARTTWAKRGAAKQAGLPYNEETVTETMLLDLKLHYPGPVSIVPFSKAQEAQFGADWAWAFVSADSAWSITMLVQAKRLDDREQLYGGIKRHIGKRIPPLRQIDQLIATAAQYGIPPIYAFYNHVGNIARVPARCGSIPSGTNEQVEAWGISLASAYAVEPHLPDETFDTHCGHSIPLHCMLCTSGTGSAGPRGSPGLVAQALANIDPGHGPDGAGLEPSAYGPHEGLHPIIALASEVASIESPAGRDAAVERLAREFPGVGGALILRDGHHHAEEIDER